MKDEAPSEQPDACLPVSRDWDVIDIALAVLIAALAVLFCANLVVDHLPHNHTSQVHLFDRFLSEDMCNQIISAAEAHTRVNGWQTHRHRNYPTTDFPLYDLKHNISIGGKKDTAMDFVTWLNSSLIDQTIMPLLQHHFHITPPAVASAAATGQLMAVLDMKDLFLVKYDALHVSSQRYLEMHIDSSLLSFIINLSPPAAGSTEQTASYLRTANELNTTVRLGQAGYQGGGTRFMHCSRPVRGAPGSIVLFPSRLFHEGLAITKGVRYIIVGFVNVHMNSTWAPFWWRFGRLGRCIDIHSHDQLSVPWKGEDLPREREQHCLSALYIYAYEARKVLVDLFFVKDDEDNITVMIK